MRKALAVLVMLGMVLMSFAGLGPIKPAMAAEHDTGLVLRVENQQIGGGHFPKLNEYLDDLKNLEEGTIIVRFRYEPGGIMSLFSLSNSLYRDGHFHVYITPSRIGSENRLEAPGQEKINTHVYVDVPVRGGYVNTLAMVVDKEEGYKFFLNGKMIMHDTSTEVKFLNNIYQPNSVMLGRTERAAGGNTYDFNGEIDFVEVYSKPLPDAELLAITGVTNKEPILNPLPPGAVITEPQSVFYPGLYNSNAYRIPSLFKTQNGTLIAGIDKRIDHAGDSPANIDIIVRRSTDDGETWGGEVLINDYPGFASNIDQSLLQDRETGRLFSLVLGFREGVGYPQAEQGTGFKTIDGKAYMLLYDANNNEYTIREGGIVYDSAGQPTEYSVDQKRYLYKNGEQVGHIFLNSSPLVAKRTSFLELWYSDDDGQTWVGPRDLNPEIKEEWMYFLGAGPGVGIQLTQPPYEERLVFPIYFTNENKMQASAVIYSDDNGQTWHRGESPNEGRIVNGEVLSERNFTGYWNELTEAQVVEMPDGQLKMFMRNYSGYARVATSFDGGETWHPDVPIEEALVAPYSQMTAIRYNGQIDGKEAVIFASAAHPSQRINGTVRAGLINEAGTYENGRTKYEFDWKYSQLVKEGAYGYSSLVNLGDGMIGLLYENGTHMDFIKFNVDYLKWERYAEPPKPELLSLSLEPPQQDGYALGDEIRIKAVFDDYVMLSGDRTIYAEIEGQAVALELAGQNEAGTEFVFSGKFPPVSPGQHELTARFSEQLRIYNGYGQALETSAIDELKENVTAKAVSDEDIVAYAVQALTIGFAAGDSAESVKKDLYLPSVGEYGTTVEWISSDESVVKADGTVIRPAYGAGDAQVVLTAVVSKGQASDTKIFTIVVKALEPWILRVENQSITSGNPISLHEYIDTLAELDEGTIIVRFRYSGSGVMSLFSLGRSDIPNNHFNLFIYPNNNTLGAENRRQESPSGPTVNTNVVVNKQVSPNQLHTLAFVADKHAGYKLFLNGELVHTDTDQPVRFFNNIYAPNSAYIGYNARPAGQNPYPFNGDIDFVEVYADPLSDEELLRITGQTNKAGLTDQEPVLVLLELEGVPADGYAENEIMRIRSVFDGYVLLLGERKLTGFLGGQPIEFQLAERNEEGTEFVFAAPFPVLPAGEHELHAVFADNLQIINVFGKMLDKSLTANQLQTTVTARATEPGSGGPGDDAPLSAALSGPERVVIGEQMQVVAKLHSVPENVYAADLTVNYNPEHFELISAESLSEHIQLVETHQTAEGRLRLVTASLGVSGAYSASSEIVRLVFLALPTEDRESTLTLFPVRLGYDDGDEEDVEGASLTVQIMSDIDTRVLEQKISEAALLLAQAKAGTRWGYYPQQAIDQLQQAAAYAQQVKDTAASQVEIDQAVQLLTEAIQQFIGSRNTKASIGDLAIMAAHYGADETHPDWNVLQMYDFNENKEIDYHDLARMAALILDN